MRPIRSLPLVTAPLFALSLTATAPPAQSPITWTVADIVDANDVSTRGELCIAVNMGPEVCATIVNGVHFMADRSHWTQKILARGASPTRGVMHFPTWTSGGFELSAPYNRTAGGIGARHSTDPAYDALLRDARHSSPGTATVTCIVSGLTPGHTYELQVFYGAASRPNRITEWDDGTGNGPGAGGIYLTPQGQHLGQVATGTFVADASGAQTFRNSQHPANGSIPETWNACSAIQVRDLTPAPNDPLTWHYGEGTPGTNTQPNLGGTACSPGIALVGHPRVGSTVTLTAENSRDVASAAVLVVGTQPNSLPLLGGTLLVSPLFTGGVPMPQPQSPYVHDHELQVPIRIPSGAGLAIYFQVLQLDPAAPGGFAMSAGIRARIGV